MIDPTSFLENLHRNHSLWAYFLKLLLSFIGFFYKTIVILRNFAFDKGYKKIEKLPASVFSVGNITAGGTGKTPTVIFLAQKIQKFQMVRPVILSRGYGQDEQKLFQQSQILHFANPYRYEAAQKAFSKHGSDLCFLLDDGFQHRSLYRDLDIVLIDSTRPFGNRNLLPRGFLREPLSHLKRADVILFTRCNMITSEALESLKSEVLRLNSKALQVESIHAPIAIQNLSDQKEYPLSFVRGKRCLAFAGIGNPMSFYRTLEKLEAQLIFRKTFPDHYAYQARDIEFLEKICEENKIEGMLTTAKDSVKWKNFHLPVWVLKISLQIIKNEQPLLSLLRENLS